MKEHLIKTKLIVTDIKHDLNNSYTKCELNDAKQELSNIKCELGNGKSDTKDQLTSALQRINTLEVLLYLATDKAVARPISSTALLKLLCCFNIR